MSLSVYMSFLHFIFVLKTCVLSDNISTNFSNATNKTLILCKACETVVSSFLNGMERTARNNFGGGDTAWEEEKLGPYSYSELRLVEIEEMLCKEQKQKDLCQTFAELWEEHLENWWFRDRHVSPDLRKYLCVDTVQFCGKSSCPKGWVEGKHKDCVDVNECSLPSSPCEDHEYCVNDIGSYSCLPCDSSCLSCSGHGPEMCTKHKSGYALKTLNYFFFEGIFMKYTYWFVFLMALALFTFFMTPFLINVLMFCISIANVLKFGFLI